MATNTNIQTAQKSQGILKLERRRRITMGIIFIVAALFIWIVFAMDVEPGTETDRKSVV